MRQDIELMSHLAGSKYDEAMEDSASPARVKFYGPCDIANSWVAEQAVALMQ
jgi:hypothetical protein